MPAMDGNLMLRDGTQLLSGNETTADGILIGGTPLHNLKLAVHRPTPTAAVTFRIRLQVSDNGSAWSDWSEWGWQTYTAYTAAAYDEYPIPMVNKKYIRHYIDSWSSTGNAGYVQIGLVMGDRPFGHV